MPLLYEKRGAVAVLTLSRPQARNAWGEDYNAGLLELLPQIEDDHTIRCVVLTGDEAGGAFSAGADLKNPKTHTSDSIAEAIEALPATQRAVISLRDVEGWTSEEVRNALDLSETNQRVLLHRARAKVRAALDSYLEQA